MISKFNQQNNVAGAKALLAVALTVTNFSLSAGDKPAMTFDQAYDVTKVDFGSTFSTHYDDYGEALESARSSRGVSFVIDTKNPLNNTLVISEGGLSVWSIVNRASVEMPAYSDQAHDSALRYAENVDTYNAYIDAAAQNAEWLKTPGTIHVVPIPATDGQDRGLTKIMQDFGETVGNWSVNETDSEIVALRSDNIGAECLLTPMSISHVGILCHAAAGDRTIDSYFATLDHN